MNVINQRALLTILYLRHKRRILFIETPRRHQYFGWFYFSLFRKVYNRRIQLS